MQQNTASIFGLFSLAYGTVLRLYVDLKIRSNTALVSFLIIMNVLTKIVRQNVEKLSMSMLIKMNL